MGTALFASGALFLIGGAADRCVADFVRLAGGRRAHIVVITHASATPRKSGREFSEQLRALGVERITVITPWSKQQTLPADTDAVYLCGGNQSRLVRLLTKSGLGQQIREANRNGMLVAGSSAGAAGAPQLMIADGMADHVLRPDSLELGRGLCLLPAGLIVDTHFAERERENRLRAALATLDGVVGIGLDEDTAVLIQGSRCRVFGAGNVWLFKRGHGGGRTWFAVADDVDVHKYSAGQTFRVPR